MCITLIMNGAVSLSMNYLYLPFAHFSFGLLFSNWFLGICKLERLALVMGVEISLSFFFLFFFLLSCILVSSTLKSFIFRF